jgi:methylated-DNA-[protein]-cysteine S-methyltransferase
MEQGFALFDTAIGRCGIAWGERGIVGLQLPPYRTVASWYLWRALDLGKDE